MKHFLLSVIIFLSLPSFPQFAPESNPHRGMYIDKFFKTELGSNSTVDPNFSILAVDMNRDGIFEKEDAVLRYAAQNHITYLNLYDLHRIFGRNYSAWDQNRLRNVNMEEHLCRFIRKAKTE